MYVCIYTYTYINNMYTHNYIYLTHTHTHTHTCAQRRQSAGTSATPLLYICFTTVFTLLYYCFTTALRGKLAPSLPLQKKNEKKLIHFYSIPVCFTTALRLLYHSTPLEASSFAPAPQRIDSTKRGGASSHASRY